MAQARRFYVRRFAEREIAEAFTWYEEKHAGLGRAFLAEIDRAFLEIRAAPERWPTWRSDRPYRKHLLRRFPFLVLYRATANDVRIVAVAHTSKKPGYWGEDP